jgi:hypothetical protein
MTTKSVQCSQTPTVMVKLGDGDWTPTCDEGLAAARTQSADAGKKDPPAKPKSAKPGSAAHKEWESAVAAHTFANRDDNLPILVRPMTTIEKKMDPPCLLPHPSGE